MIKKIKLELENELLEINKRICDFINDTNKERYSLKELEDLFYINNIDNFSTVLFDVINHQYIEGDDYSYYDEIESIEEKRVYDEAINFIYYNDYRLFNFYHECLNLLQSLVSEVYVRNVNNIKYNYDIKIILKYLKECFDYDLIKYCIINDIDNEYTKEIILSYKNHLDNYYDGAINEETGDFMEYEDILSNIDEKINSFLSDIKKEITKECFDNILKTYYEIKNE